MSAAAQTHQIRTGGDVLDVSPVIPVVVVEQVEQAVPLAQALLRGGIPIIEITLRSAAGLAAIEAVASQVEGMVVGAGTVLTPAAVRDVHAAGGRMIVAPNFDAAVVRESVRLGMVSLPGVMSPTEAFAALAAGAAALKLFPAEAIGPAVVKALRAVLDPTVRVLPVGGITPANIADYRAAGASGFGIGSSLYKPGMTVAQVAVQARRWVDTWRAR